MQLRQAGQGTEAAQRCNKVLCHPSMRVGTKVQALQGCELSNLGARGEHGWGRGGRKGIEEHAESIDYAGQRQVLRHHSMRVSTRVQGLEGCELSNLCVRGLAGEISRRGRSALTSPMCSGETDPGKGGGGMRRSKLLMVTS